MKQFERKVINRSNLPVKFPLFQTLVVILTLDYYNATQWVCGAVGVIMGLMWINAAINIYKNTEIDLFSDSKDTDKGKK